MSVAERETIREDVEPDDLTLVVRRFAAGWLPHTVGPDRTSWWWGRPRDSLGYTLWTEGLTPSMVLVERMTDSERDAYLAALG